MSKRVDEKIEQIRADAISWLFHESACYLKEMLDEEGWSVEELREILWFALSAASELRRIESLEAICRKAGLDEQSAQLKARAWTDRIVRSFDHD